MTRKKTIWLSLLLLAAMFFPSVTRSQVTIGDKTDPQPFSLLEISTAQTKGGLRLPQLTTAERNALNVASNTKEAKGLVIYNTDNNCLEYWNLTKWISLCAGNADISFTNPGGNPSNPADKKDPTQPPFPAEGETRGPFVPHDNPESTARPPYTFTVVAGEEYTHIRVINEVTGEFTVTMDANPSIEPRTAIVRVTDNSTGEYKEFLFTQNGIDSATACDPSKTVPAISGWNGMDICGSGAAYLYLSGVSGTATDINNYIWTLDGREVGRGASYIATQSGTYCVYYKTIGCTQNSGNKTINAGSNGSNPAPNKIDVLVAENDGYVCDAGSKVKLVANVTNLQSGEMVIWFKDNVRQSAMDNQSTISAGVGVWYCVVVNGSCSSMPSESKTIQVDPNAGKGGTAVSNPDVKVNGVPLSSATLCKGGVVMFEVTNPQTGVNYVWKLDNTEIGTGTSISYLVPSTMTGNKAIRCTAKSQSQNTCQVEAFAETSVSTGSTPQTPYITVNTKDALCGGSATLTANFTGTPTAYNWYKKDGTTLTFVTTTGTNPNYTVTQAGEYAVSVMAGGCSSSISGSKTIVASDFGTINWTLQPATANIGETKTFSVQITPDYKSTYFWTVTNGTITNGQGTNTITVNFPTATQAIISVQAENACGAISGTSSINVAVADACTPPTVTQSNGTTQTVTSGSIANMSVTATGTPTLTYQWYTGTVGTEANPISGQTGSSYSPMFTTTGASQFWCKVTNACGSSSSAQFTITVDQNPANIAAGTGGTFLGCTCFDIARSNDDQDNCGTLNIRQNMKADFTQMAINTQTYTFTPIGPVSKVRFAYVERETGKIVQSFVYNEAYKEQTSINSACTVTLVYKSSLNDDAYGLTGDNALKVDIYAIYNDNASGTGTEKAIKLTATIKDCQCCVGYMARGGEYSGPSTTTLGNVPANPTIADFITYGFAPTGRDLCFYKTNGNNGKAITWNNATDNGANPDKFCVTGTWADGTAGWRLPNLAELAAIQNIAFHGTADGVNTGIGAELTATPGTRNMLGSHWSSTTKDATHTWTWAYGGGNASPQLNQYSSYGIRCVQGF